MKKRITATLLAAAVCFGAIACSPQPASDMHANANNAARDASVAQTITREVMEQKIQGAWMGAFWGNFTGLPTEFKFIDQPGPDSALDWAVSNCYCTDDDTSFEYVFLHMMEVYGADTITYEDMPAEWIYHFQDYLWVGNLSALNLMKQGYVPPETGMIGINPDYAAIDAQIECEIFGMVTPGMLQNCKDRTKWWLASVGYGTVLDNSAFYAMLCADAFFEDDIYASLDRVRSYFPNTSETAKIYDAVKTEFVRDPENWKAARQSLYEKYYLNGGRNTLDNRINFAMTLLSLFYGNNDYKDTVGIAVLAGFDNDCNAATAGTIMGLQKGIKGLPNDLAQKSGDYYLNTNRPGLPSATIAELATRVADQAEDIIVNAGGIKNGNTYTIFDAPFTPAEKSDSYTKPADPSQWTYSGMNKFYNPSLFTGYGYGTTAKGGYAELKFVGDEITVYASTSPNGGSFAVTVDGADYGVVSLKAEETFTDYKLITVSHRQALKCIRGLGGGEHTLRLTAREDGRWHSVDYATVVCSADEYYDAVGLNYARTAAATAIASVLTPLGAGAGGGGLGCIHDGLYFADGMHSSKQYDSYLGRNGSGVNYPKTGDDYVGYEFDRELTVGRIVFNEGGHWGEDGGWFANGSLRVEALIGGVWTNIAYNITPAYPNGDSYAAMGGNGGGGTYTLTFAQTKARGIRLIGTPGGANKLISCGELEVYKA